MFRWSSLLFLLVTAVITSTAALATNHAPSPAKPLVSAHAPAPCRSEPPVRLDGTPAMAGAMLLASNGALRLLACAPSALTFQADGTEAHAVYARLVVTENGHPLADTQVDGSRSFAITVPTAGWVLIAFPNDLYDPPADRNLRLSSVALHPDNSRGHR